MAPTISSSTVWVRDGVSVSERVASQLPSASAAIRPQVTTTVSLIGTGPMEKSVVVDKRRADHGLRSPPNHGRARRQNAGGGGEQGQRAEIDGDDGKRRRRSPRTGRTEPPSRAAASGRRPASARSSAGSKRRRRRSTVPAASQPAAKRQVVRREVRRDHCLCIHFQADQQPMMRPSPSKGALQKMPVPNL